MFENCVQTAQRAKSVPALNRLQPRNMMRASSPKFCLSKSLPTYMVFFGCSSGRWRSDVPKPKLWHAALKTMRGCPINSLVTRCMRARAMVSSTNQCARMDMGLPLVLYMPQQHTTRGHRPPGGSRSSRMLLIAESTQRIVRPWPRLPALRRPRRLVVLEARSHCVPR
jgi:hypothetical protein